jgi:hypothetical protein
MVLVGENVWRDIASKEEILVWKRESTSFNLLMMTVLLIALPIAYFSATIFHSLNLLVKGLASTVFFLIPLIDDSVLSKLPGIEITLPYGG